MRGLTLISLLIRLKNIRIRTVGRNSLPVISQPTWSVPQTTQSSWCPAGTPSSAELCGALLVQELVFHSCSPVLTGRAPGMALHPQLGVDSLEALRGSRAMCGTSSGGDEAPMWKYLLWENQVWP